MAKPDDIIETHLPREPEELLKIAAIRKRLVGKTDRDDHIAEVDGWEKRAKAALILLNLKKHEGIQMVLKQAIREIREIDIVLKTQEPIDLSPEGCTKFATETMVLHERRRLWTWLVDLFAGAENDLNAIREEIDAEEVDDEEIKAIEEEMEGEE